MSIDHTIETEAAELQRIVKDGGAARAAAFAAGATLVTRVGDQLVEERPDGTRTVLKELPPRIDAAEFLARLNR